MGSATKWPTLLRKGSVWPLHHRAPRGRSTPTTGETRKAPTLPTRGYRKGISDRKQPVPRSIRTHVTDRMFARHVREADARNLTLSRLLFEILKAHQSGTRLAAPQPRAVDAALLRELARIGNNVNQVAHQANLMNLPLIADRAEACLASLDDLLRRMRA